MRGFIAGLIFLILSAPLASAEPAYIAIIIDDVGNHFDRGNRAIQLPGPVTFSILPYLQFSAPLAHAAFRAGKEVMVHMPMATIMDSPIGPGGLEPLLPKSEFLFLLDQALASVPHASGINNHMGSYLTQQSMEMNWLMDEVKKRNLFFVDSRTTAKTVAYRVALEKQVFSSSRDVFLDNQLTFYDIDIAFRQLIRKAKLRGTAIGIGHPHDMTLDYLTMAIPHLDSQNVRLVPASNLIALQRMTAIQFAHDDSQRNEKTGTSD